MRAYCLFYGVYTGDVMKAQWVVEKKESGCGRMEDGFI